MEKTNEKNELTDNSNEQNPHLYASDFKKCRDEHKDVIIAPFNAENAKGVGYNLSLSEMIYSLKNNALVPISRNEQETFFYIKPHETVLALSYEYINVSENIAGSFHSKVRVAATGIGSISTTLDPNWSGMVLFSLNNPTNKKIKIVISSYSDGIKKRNTFVTMLAWRINSVANDKSNEVLLQLDNPPMRIDILTELTSKRFKVFNDNRYQHLCQIVKSFSDSVILPSSSMNWTETVKKLITELSTSIFADKAEEKIRASLIKLKSISDDLPQSMSIKLKELTKILTEDELIKKCKSEEYRKIIASTYDEIKYLLLCDKVSQIHEIISEHIPTSWHNNRVAHILYHIKKNIGTILSIITCFGLIILGNIIGNSFDFSLQLTIALASSVISVLLNYIINKDDKS